MAETGNAEGYVAHSGAWDPGLLTQIIELNVQVLEAVRRRAFPPDPSAALAEVAPLWRQLGDEGLQALARSPYLMLDAGFSRPDYWDNAVHEVQPSGHWLAGSLAPGLLRRAVVLGWHLARANPFAARMTLGMTPRCATLIAHTRLHDLDNLVERRSQYCRLRWEDRPAVWRQLLQATLSGNSASLESLQLRGFQLMAAENGSRTT